MNQFEYISVLLSIIVGLGIVHLLTGISRLIQRPRELRVYWVHLVWVAYQFLQLVFFWWWEFQFNEIPSWTFPLYFFLVLYATAQYLPSVVLFPYDLPSGFDFRSYYYERRKWFFGLWILTLCMDLVDTYAKGPDHVAALGVEYPIRLVAYISAFIVASFWSNPYFHAVFAVLATSYQFLWAIRLYLSMPGA